MNDKQKQSLLNAIHSYDYPAKLYDFERGQPICYETMRELESELRNNLRSDDPIRVKYALANIIYWGNINAGYVMVRVQTFLRNVTSDKVERAMELFRSLSGDSPREIKRIKLPQFSNMSFISKILMFLDPANYVTLDRELLKLKKSNIPTIFSRIKEYPTYIPVTNHNCEQYKRWCGKCRDTVDCHFQNSGLLAVDVERGIYHLIRKGKLDIAAGLVASMP